MSAESPEPVEATSPDADYAAFLQLRLVPGDPALDRLPSGALRAVWSLPDGTRAALAFHGGGAVRYAIIEPTGGRTAGLSHAGTHRGIIRRTVERARERGAVEPLDNRNRRDRRG